MKPSGDAKCYTNSEYEKELLPTLYYIKKRLGHIINYLRTSM